jgi:glyoxylase-like metal-dependent hydrolase (beta-lactamase superfamily II)
MGSIHTLDLNFLGLDKTIAAYVIPHKSGAALVECGPSSTISGLIAGLQVFGLKPQDISDVFLTHIHLDHSGAAGWLARQGTRIHVHSLGAPHLANPDRLLASAQKIYGDQMEYLWGEFLPVPEQQIVTHSDYEIIEIGDLHIKAIETPGHAYHHCVYICEDICFSGDVGGIRLQHSPHIRLPMPPPEFHLELWQETLNKLTLEYSSGSFSKIAPTHFGIFEDAGWHLQELGRLLDEISTWIDQVMPAKPSIVELNEIFLSHTRDQARNMGLTEMEIRALEAANPSWMAASGIHRYWHKIRLPARENGSQSSLPRPASQ